MQRALTVVLGLALIGIAGGASAQIVPVNADIVGPGTTTWGPPNVYVLQQPIFVRNGAILRILPGTIVRGQPRSGPVLPNVIAGTPGALIVSQTGRINAVGTSTQPIIFTTAAIDNVTNATGLPPGDNIPDDVNMDGFEDPWTNAADVFYDDSPATAPLAPLDAAGNCNVSLWGGVVIVGNAPTNLADQCGIGYGLCTVEGLTFPGFAVANARYGGDQANDNSGTMRYVSIRHTGDELGEGNELNGLTLAGVGSGTTIEFIEVYSVFDDGIEMFGGTVNGRNQHVVFAADDSIDVDQGYTGVEQFVFVIMGYFDEDDGGVCGSRSGDKAGEFDGEDWETSDPVDLTPEGNVNVRSDVFGYDNNDPLINPGAEVDPEAEDSAPWPLSASIFYNVTIIGSTPDAPLFRPPVDPTSTNRGIQFRNGYAGEVHNSIIVNVGGETGIELDTTGPAVAGHSATDHANAGLTSLVCTTLDDSAALGAGETTISTSGNTLNLALGGTALGNNTLSVGANPSAFLLQEDATFALRGDANGKLSAGLKTNANPGIANQSDDPINPRPALALGSGGCVGPQGPGLNAGATYRGAFDRTAPAGALWTTGWTALSVSGLMTP